MQNVTLRHHPTRALGAALIALLLATAPLGARAQELAPDDGPAHSVQSRLFTLGSGALLGVVAFNLLTAPLGTVPLAGAALAPVPTSIALGSRLLAAGSGAAGAIGAVWLYDQATGRPFEAGWIASLAGGAAAGVAVGNLLGAGMLGTLPYYPGVGGEAAAAGGTLASAAGQAASRVYVIGSGVLGALTGGYLYQLFY